MVALVGCTATGKTAVAEHVAALLGGEVVCADSRQVFRELDVGTGKPDVSQRLIRPHHLFESLSVAAYAPPRSEGGEELPRATAGWYARAAREICAAIHARGRIPVLVGGSGLYLSAALRGLAPTPDVDPAVRVRLASDLAAAGAAEMHARLARLDPESARGIHAADAQRITRALEVIESTGRSIAWWRARPASSPIEGAWRTFQLIAEPDELRRRIAGRTHWMFESGLIEEARALSERGWAAALARLRAIGYDEALALLGGRIGRDQAEERTRQRTAQLAKRQRTWFRHQLPSEPLDTHSASAEQLADAIVARVRAGG